MTGVETVNVIEAISAKTATLPEAAQREVLDFVEFLLHKTAQNDVSTTVDTMLEAPLKQIHPPVRSVIGLFEDRGIKISEEDIAEARREMWGNFPREFPEP